MTSTASFITPEPEAEIQEIERQMNDLRKRWIDLKRQQEETVITEYLFKDQGGKDRKLSSLFGESQELIVAHFMGSWCGMCATWASGWNGMFPAITSRAPFVVVSPDTIEEIERLRNDLKYRFPFLSAKDTTFLKDMKLLSSVGDFWEKRYGLPGGKPVADEKDVMYRCYTVYMTPDSMFCPLYPLYNVLDLLPNGRAPFIPRVRYEAPQTGYNLTTSPETAPNAEE